MRLDSQVRSLLILPRDRLSSPNESHTLRISFPFPHPRRNLFPRLRRAVKLLAASGLDPHLATHRIMPYPPPLAPLLHPTPSLSSPTPPSRVRRLLPCLTSLRTLTRLLRQGPKPLPRPPTSRSRILHAAKMVPLLHCRNLQDGNYPTHRDPQLA